MASKNRDTPQGKASWRQKTLERKTLLITQGYGLDSVQGHLEMAHWYNTAHVNLCSDPNEANEFNSMYPQLTQLEKEGYVVLEWTRENNGNEDYLRLRQIALTTSGNKLLGELQAKSKWGRIKERVVGIAWAAATSVITTLLVLWLKR